MSVQASVQDRRSARVAPAAIDVNATLLALWLFLRILTQIVAIYIAALRPRLARELAIPLWPPSAPLGAWLERVLLAPWERRDAVYFVSIVQHGYSPDNGTAIFHPLLPWLAAPLHWLIGQPLLALLLVASAAGLLAVLAFYRLARLDLDPKDAEAAALVFTLSPLAFTLFVPYAEALFLLWAVLCLYWARCRAWWLAGLAGGLATLTRQQGIVLVLPLAWELWVAHAASPRKALAGWRAWLPLALIPGTYVLWLGYRAVVVGDLRADYSSLQGAIYSILISPSAAKVVPVQAFYWPWQTLWLAVSKFVAAPEYDTGLDLALGLGFLVMLALAWPRLRASYRIYALGIVLMALSYYTGPHYPYMGLPRHLLLAFPVFIGVAPLLRAAKARNVAVAVGGGAMLFLLGHYIIEGWVP